MTQPEPTIVFPFRGVPIALGLGAGDALRAGHLWLASLALASSLLLAPAPGRADPPADVTMRSGNHPGYGRVVFDAPPDASFQVARDGDTLTIRFAPGTLLHGSAAAPHNVSALRADGDHAELTIAAGSTFHAARLGSHVVIDVFDPAAAGSTTAADQPAAAAAERSTGAHASPQPHPDTGSEHAPAAAAPSPAALSAAAADPMLLPLPPDPPSATGDAPLSLVTSDAPPAANGHPVLQAPDRIAALALDRSDPPPPARSSAEAPAGRPSAPALSGPASASPPAQLQAAGAGLRPPAAAARLEADPQPGAAGRPRRTDVSAASPGSPSLGTRSLSAASPGAASPGAAFPGAASPGASASDASAAGGAPGGTDPAATATPQPLELPPIAAQPANLPADSKGQAISLPFINPVGAAVFVRHGETLVLLDQRNPIDLTAVQSGPFASARAELLPAATLIHLSPPPDTAVTLTRTPQGWTIAVLDTPPPIQPLASQFTDTAVNVAARQPGGVVAVTDPVTGGVLLVGTQRTPGEGTVLPLRTPQFTLLPTTQGVVALALADTVALSANAGGFTLTTAPAPLAVSRLDSDLLGDATALTRRFAFPNLPPEQLTERLAREMAAGAEQPLLARGPMRRAAALTMISLGMDAEAESLLQMAAEDDPRIAASADVAGLTGIAALLAGRPAEANGIDDPRLTGTDEMVLWRALRIATRDPASPEAAAALIGSAPLLLSYPPGIRDKVLPLAVETLVRGGAKAAAQQLLARSRDIPGLGLARAMLSQANGDTADALARYDALAAGPDQLVSTRAAVRAINLRLATGKTDKRQAAEALDRQLYAWRGDQRELALRDELAGLRQQLGEWREALTLLRDTETLFPDQAATIHARLQQTFDAMLHGDAADNLPPLEFVALVDENADLVAASSQGEAMQTKLADRLLALDLPDRAGPVLEKLMRNAPAGAGRAGLGARLAKLRLHEGDATGALAALAASEEPNLPAPLAEQRLLLRADAQAQSGDVAGAVGLLADLDTPAAADERAAILERARDWPAAEHALTDLAARTVPDSGALTDTARRTLLRLATAAAHAGDEATLDSLRVQDDQRMGEGPLADMFRLLTTDPVHAPADLPRAVTQVGLAKALPTALQAVQPLTRTQ